jgi:hypothetical protein
MNLGISQDRDLEPVPATIRPSFRDTALGDELTEDQETWLNEIYSQEPEVAEAELEIEYHWHLLTLWEDGWYHDVAGYVADMDAAERSRFDAQFAERFNQTRTPAA